MYLPQPYYVPSIDHNSYFSQDFVSTSTPTETRSPAKQCFSISLTSPGPRTRADPRLLLPVKNSANPAARIASNFTETLCSPPALMGELWKIRAPFLKLRKHGKPVRPAGRGKLAMNSDISCRPTRFWELSEEIRSPVMCTDPNARDNLGTSKKSDFMQWNTCDVEYALLKIMLK